MEKYCPITTDMVDVKLIKANATFVLVMLVLSLALQIPFLVYIVSLDFAIRVFFGIKNSPVCRILIKSMSIMNVKQHKVNAGPKKLAAKFGLVFSLLILIFNLFELPMAAMAVTCLFILLTGLEVFFSYCLVCSLYPYLNRIGIK